MQITEALDRAARVTPLVGFEVREEDGRVDVGNWPGWLDANIRAFAIVGSNSTLAARDALDAGPLAAEYEACV